MYFIHHLIDIITDWFHITMRITMLKQMTKSFTAFDEVKGMKSKLEKIKWYLWHGNTFDALQKIWWLCEDVSWIEPEETAHPERYARLTKSLSEFHTYCGYPDLVDTWLRVSCCITAP